MRASILNILLGLWLMISPALLNLEKEAADNNYIFGPVILTFGIIALWEVNRSVQYFNILPGAWLAVSPIVLGLSLPETLWATMLPGIMVAGFSFLKSNIKTRYGGGWYCLFKKDAPTYSSEES